MKYLSAAVLIFAGLHVIYGEKDTKIASGRIESCPGCSLNRLKEVKQFIYDDLPNYDNIFFMKIHGAAPELVLVNADEEEIERIPLSKLSKQECNDLLFSKGFSLKKDTKVASGRVESCPGCSLNRLKEVKQFIYEDLPLYDNIIFKKIGGAPPELVLLNAADEELERIRLADLSRKQCNDLLISKGISLKEKEVEDEIPKEEL